MWSVLEGKPAASSRIIHTQYWQNLKKYHNLTSCHSQSFKKKSLMTAHERIHNDDRPYECADCPKAFRDLGALNSHKIRLHSRENLKFSCELCR